MTSSNFGHVMTENLEACAMASFVSEALSSFAITGHKLNHDSNEGLKLIFQIIRQKMSYVQQATHSIQTNFMENHHAQLGLQQLDR